MQTVIASFNRADPGPFDRTVELLHDRYYDLYLLRFERGQPWINPAVPREAAQYKRQSWPTEASARGYIKRTFAAFGERVEINATK